MKVGYNFYIDESGNHNLSDIGTKFFVLSAVGVGHERWQDMDGKVREVKERYFHGIPPEDVEIKGAYIRHRKGVYNTLSPQEMDLLEQDVMQLVYDFSEVIFSIVIDKLSLIRSYDEPTDPYDLAIEFLLERIEKFLEKRDSYGFLVFDSRASRRSNDLDAYLKKEVREFQKNGTWYKKIERIWEEPFFVVSHTSAGVQIADFVAYSTYQVFSRKKPEHSWFSSFLHKLDRDASGRLIGSGLKVFPTEILDSNQGWGEVWQKRLTEAGGPPEFP